MATDPLESLRLTLMQEVLPVGMAVVERARRGGPREVAEAFTAADDPLGRLRQEGDAAARELRDSLDRLQPGLGNPVMKVQVRDIPTPAPESAGGGDPDPGAESRELQRALVRIADRLALLEQRLSPQD
ncbi:MAG: hypothetical protein EBR33_00230 [Synechococcaceae bacterium WB4_1_0192]|jgi:hypothetical protein|nr:hypothetical protein [Synechococcaceae bacterium WB4_1_0192]